MMIFGLVLLCIQGLFHISAGQALPCANNINFAPSLAFSSCQNQNSKSLPNPLTITSAKFTPISSGLASKAGLIGATISEVVPNLQFGDFSLTGDLPIGGTIKVSGCFPVYGMVAVDGAVPSAGTAVVNTASSFAAQLLENTCAC